MAPASRPPIAAFLGLQGIQPGVGSDGDLDAAWAALACGQPLLDEVVADLEQRARQDGRADGVVEAACLRALGSAHLGDMGAALAAGRRAFRMGRTEKLRGCEVLAGVVLARLRRLTGRAHLAARIATALRDVAPRPWHPWVEWELVLASGAEVVGPGPALELRGLLDAAKAGDPTTFAERLASLTQELSGLAPMLEDLARVRTALDPRADSAAAGPEVEAWVRGHLGYGPPPWGLAALSHTSSDSTEAESVALVVASPGAPGRRLLSAASGLAASVADTATLPDGPGGRSDALASTLALLGPDGATDEHVFGVVYGFSYVPSLHRGTFDVALHRARALLASHGEILREDGRISLELRQAVVLADPRSAPATDARVLGHLARSGQLSARELARHLGVSLRTTQDALRSLVEDGACQQRRAGRAVLYDLEDTTFQPPTEI